MPDTNGKGTDREQPPLLPVAVDAQPANTSEEKVKLPPTEAERKKLHLEMVLKESEDERFERRKKDMALHLEVHMLNVAEAHEKHPAPLTRDFENWTDAQQRSWNERSKTLASANRAYHLALRATFAKHQEEDRHIRREAAKKENA